MIACKGIHYAFLYDYIRKATKKKIVKKTQKLGSVTIFSYICGRIHKMMQQMNKKDKLLKRFYSQPKDFTFDEMVSVFSCYGFHQENKGATSGSRVIFVNDIDGNCYIMHKPHPSNIIKGYVMRQVFTFLKANGYINKQEEHIWDY